MRKIKCLCFICFLISICFIYFFSYDKTFKTSVLNYNGNNLKISIDGNDSNTFPNSGNYYLANYKCNSSDTKVYWDSEKKNISITNGKKNNGVFCNLDFQTNPKIYDMEVGSYVDYVGTNGCNEVSSTACSGGNVEKNYCGSYSSYRFADSGWRVAYKKDGNAYLITGGAPQCLSTNSSGVPSATVSSNSETTSGHPKHLANINNAALKYCNTNFVDGGVCSIQNTRNMNADDYYNILKKTAASCNGMHLNSCGKGRDLIDIGSYYWLAINYSDRVFKWNGEKRYLGSDYTMFDNGVRPVIKLDPNVVVVGGSGTKDDPYQIGNNSFHVTKSGTTATLKLISYNASQMCVSVNNSVCTSYTTFSASKSINLSSYNTNYGKYTIYVYYKNSDGKVVASMSKNIS